MAEKGKTLLVAERSYAGLLTGVVDLLQQAHRASARSINAIITATYWEIGRRIVEHEQRGKERAAYGQALIERLAADLTARFGRGFSQTNLKQMREFYLGWSIRQTLSDESGTGTSPSVKLETRQTPSDESDRRPFPLPWSHYVRLLSVKNALARTFYETEALRGGWSVRQLDRQISTLFYERTALFAKKSRHAPQGSA